MSFVYIRHRGYLWKVRKSPTETEEMAQDRAWHIAQTMSPSTPEAERESKSRQWMNTKYYHIKYQNEQENRD